MSNPVPLEYGKYYHIYNCGNNRENLFVEERNYAYFLKLYAAHIEPIADTFAYCLMRNHFHVLVRIRDLSGLPAPSQAFSNLFNAYAKAFNRTYGRSGALFQRPFGRIEITGEAYFCRLVVYIHQNPQKHGFVSDFRDWPHSSYHALLSAQPTRLKRAEALAWFGGVKNLKAVHQQIVDAGEMMMLAPEDLET